MSPNGHGCTPISCLQSSSTFAASQLTGELVWSQILALFSDYDMSWPHATVKALSFAGAFNIGIALTAPEVRVGGPLLDAADLHPLKETFCMLWNQSADCFYSYARAPAHNLRSVQRA